MADVLREGIDEIARERLPSRDGARARESDLERAFHQHLPPLLTQLSPKRVLRPTQWRPSWNDWPRVGGIDLTIETNSAPEAFVELKFRGDELWQTAFDVAKMAYANLSGAAAECYLVAAAETVAWQGKSLGPDLFCARSLDTESFLEDHRSSFDTWRRREDPMPTRLPQRIQITPAHSASMQLEAEAWEIRCARIEGLPGWIDVGPDAIDAASIFYDQSISDGRKKAMLVALANTGDRQAEGYLSSIARIEAHQAASSESMTQEQRDVMERFLRRPVDRGNQSS